MNFPCIVADPAWRFDDALGKRGAEANYRTLSVRELEALPIESLAAKDAYLFMWRVAAMPMIALQLCERWGFVPKSELVWIKQTRTGKRHFGMGHHVRAEHEVCIIATRGRAKPLVHNIRSTFTAPVGRHSERPGEFFRIVEALCKGPRLELFARTHRPGWSAIGDEL